jgi:hypothetical protein
MSTANELLAKAKAVFQKGRANYRDALLEVGGLLHEFILARLKSGDQLGADRRRRAKIVRRLIVKEAAESLAVSYKKIHHLIWATQIARLLGRGGLGELGHAAIGNFRRLIRRCSVGRRNYGKGRISEAESFRVRAGFEESGVALFQQAVAENWGQKRAAEEVAAFLKAAGLPSARGRPKGTPDKKPRRPSSGKNYNPTGGQQNAPDRRSAAALASPGDVAEMCLELVQASADPWAVAQRLMGELAKIKRPKAAYCA